MAGEKKSVRNLICILVTIVAYILITNKNTLYNIGTSPEYSVMTYMGIESKREWIYVYI